MGDHAGLTDVLVTTELPGLLFDIRRYSVHDGPGIRTTVFFKGCPLSCWWCHNPEGREPRPTLMLLENRCRKCGACFEVCPHQAIVKDGFVTTSACRACGSCVEVCLAGAREIAGRWMTVPEVMREIEKDLVFYDESGGGVTFSGGEPLAQPLFLEALLDACRQRRIHTLVDTCGFAECALLLHLSQKVDMFYYDLKFLDPARHEKYCGVSNAPILENLEALTRTGKKIVIRFPIIPGINDHPEDIKRMALFLAGLRLPELHLLPYHRMGSSKYDRLRIDYRLGALETPSSEEIQRVAQQFEYAGLAVTVGG